MSGMFNDIGRAFKRAWKGDVKRMGWSDFWEGWNSLPIAERLVWTLMYTVLLASIAVMLKMLLT